IQREYDLHIAVTACRVLRREVSSLGESVRELGFSLTNEECKSVMELSTRLWERVTEPTTKKAEAGARGPVVVLSDSEQLACETLVSQLESSLHRARVRIIRSLGY
ncbi:MAG: hypothetical protein MUE41_14175, partial [Gemmatimonadaceae bacterium]|nr:hypothetical protein [Gemmatimonadaceae bacterium]